MSIIKPLSAEQLRSLANVALGNEKADLAILGGDVVNVYSGELLEGWAVAVKGDRIAYVGPDASHTVDHETRVIDASGKVLIPGFIDGHAHVMHTYGTLDEFLKYVIPTGTTTIISETLDFAFTLGYEGALEYLEACRNQPIKLFATAPSTIANGQLDYRSNITSEQFQNLLEHEMILGVGESNWVPAIRGNQALFELFAHTLSFGKKLEGHAAGAKGNKLVAFAATGNSSDHEPITADEALDRLRLGMYVLIREGDVRNDLEAVSKIKDWNVDLRRLSISTDGIGVKHLMNVGYLNSVAQKAIELGFDPITAIQMVSLNVAEHFGIDDVVGGISPGRFADVIVIANLKNIKPEVVISNGRIIAQKGVCMIEPEKHKYPDILRDTIRFPRDIGPEDFSIRVDHEAGQVTARVIDLGRDIANKEAQMEMNVVDCEVKADVERNIIKISAIDRVHNSGKMFTGLIRGFGLKKGAIGVTASWDAANIIVVGASDQDMAKAVEHIRKMGGGSVVVVDGQVLADLPMPIACQTSELPMKEIDARMDQIQQIVSDLGCTLPYAHLMMVTLTTTIVPSIRISTSGLLDIKSGKTVDLFV